MMKVESGKRKAESGRRDTRGSRPGHAGFTLVELLAVVALIGLMMMVVLPSLQPSKGTSLIGAARQFSNDINMARQYAIAHNYRTRVVIATDKTIRDSQTSLPDLMSMQYSAYAILQQARLSGGVAWSGSAPQNQPNLPIGRNEWTYTQAWKFLPKGVIFDPAETDLKSSDGKSLSLPKTTIFFGDMAARDLWDGVTLDKLPFPYRNSSADPPRGCEMAFIEFKNNGIPTMAGSVRLINGIVQVNRGSSGSGNSVTVIVQGRESPTSASSNDPASQNCVVLSWDNLVGRVKWIQPGT